MNRPLLIICLLQQLDAVHPIGLRADSLATGARAMGHPGTDSTTVISLMADCAEKQLVTSSVDAFDGTVKLYHRTETARVLLVNGGHI